MSTSNERISDRELKTPCVFSFHLAEYYLPARLASFGQRLTIKTIILIQFSSSRRHEHDFVVRIGRKGFSVVTSCNAGRILACFDTRHADDAQCRGRSCVIELQDRMMACPSAQSLQFPRLLDIPGLPWKDGEQHVFFSHPHIWAIL